MSKEFSMVKFRCKGLGKALVMDFEDEEPGGKVRLMMPDWTSVRERKRPPGLFDAKCQ